MLSHYNSLHKESSDTPMKPPLLFLVGEQRRDIIPNTLMSPHLSDEQRINVDELVVYETGVMQSFPSDFERSIALCRRQTASVTSIVVFSPSGCEAMLLSLGYIDPQGKLTRQGEKNVRWPSTTVDVNGNDMVENGKSKEPKFCIASIGPTTRDYLHKTWGFEVDVCAEKPSPEEVGEGISQFLQGHGMAAS